MTNSAPNTALTRMRDRAITDRTELDRLLDETVIAHVGMADDQGGVVVIPTAVVRDGDRVLVHGSTGSGDTWAGVVPFDARRIGDPMPAPDLREGIPVPPSVLAMTGRHPWRAAVPL